VASPKSQTLKGSPFPAGEIPVSYEHTYKKADGSVIDLTGHSPEIKIDGPDEDVDYAQGLLQIDGDPTTGQVYYTWTGGEFIDVGKYEMIVWVGNGLNRYGSDLVKWEVYDAPGELPTV
jgi:hypothetical protein